MESTAQTASPGAVRSSRRARGRRTIGLVVALIGAALLVGTAADFGAGLLQEHRLDQAWQDWRSTHSVPQASWGEPNPAWLHPVDGVDFAISVPKIGYFAAVREGVGSATLASGPGHYPTMKWPGQTGNVGVAAHNIYWIRFNDLQRGDDVILQTRWGDYRYQVTGKRLVWPDDLTVLVPTTDHRLTLTTCWPLWAGAFATQRLIITAEQIHPRPNGPSGAS
jgi:LPXTG-site transpeptidase (sortase) family protein